MYEKVLAAICTAAVVLGVLWFVCKRNSDGRGSNGTGSDAKRIRDNITEAETNNKRLADAEQRTRDTIERARETSKRTTELIESAGEDLERSQELINKARDILGRAKHTSGN